MKSGILNSLAFEPIRTCESCLEGKMIKRPFKTKGYRATKPLELVHTDVCGPMRVQAKDGYEYFVTFTYDYSRYGFVTPQTRGSVDYPSTRGILGNVGRPDIFHENRAESPLYGELYPNTKPAYTCPKQCNIILTRVKRPLGPISNTHLTYPL